MTYDSKLTSEIILNYVDNFQFFGFKLIDLLLKKNEDDTYEPADDFQRIDYTKTTLFKYPILADSLFNQIIADNFEKYFILPETLATNKSQFIYFITKLVVTLEKIGAPYLKVLEFLLEHHYFETHNKYTRTNKIGNYDQPINDIEADGYLNNKVSQQTTDENTTIDPQNLERQKILEIGNKIVDAVSHSLFLKEPYVEPSYFA